ncbi:MAG: YkuS family protein [Bacillota bacterium]
MYTKIIAVQNGLENLVERLERKGYMVTDLNGGGYPIDAIVYSENKGYAEPPMITSAAIPSNNQYVIMLNADELSENEILNRIDSLK